MEEALVAKRLVEVEFVIVPLSVFKLLVLTVFPAMVVPVKLEMVVEARVEDPATVKLVA